MLGLRKFARIALWMAPLALSSCMRPPDDGVTAAKRAYQEALEAEADRYSPESLAVASRALDAALVEVGRQGEKASPLRDYSRARVLLGQAQQVSRGAVYEALARRDEIRKQTANILEEANRDLLALEQSVPTPDEVDSTEWRTWIRRFREASDTLTAARRAFRDGDYFDAHVQAARAVEQLSDIASSEPSS